MGNHDLGRETALAHPAAKATRWGEDYGMRGLVERDRPYIDDYPAHRPGWEAGSRWGTRPDREFAGRSDRGLAGAEGSFRLAWKWIRSAFRPATAVESRGR